MESESGNQFHMQFLDLESESGRQFTMLVFTLTDSIEVYIFSICSYKLCRIHSALEQVVAWWYWNMQTCNRYDAISVNIKHNRKWLPQFSSQHEEEELKKELFYRLRFNRNVLYHVHSQKLINISSHIWERYYKMYVPFYLFIYCFSTNHLQGMWYTRYISSKV